MKVSVIIPAYNEEKRLPETLKKIKNFLKKNKIKNEIIVVDDGSTDNTVSISKKYKVKVLKNEKNKGKGFSVKRGMLAARGEIVIFTDADLSTPVEFLKHFINEHKSGFDIVIASRALQGSEIKIPQPYLRELSGKIFNVLVRLITWLPIHDTQCGFKSFTRKAAQQIFKRLTIYGFGFDVEALYIARKLGFTISEYPVSWYNSKATKVDFLKDSIRMFFELFKIRLNDIKGLYK
ncbi:MAG: glycosyltransferase family 2 protein [Candidatus Goldbacteria bacterium]|nr:glycosyltransferase family 2 protein [Candidatus Goldiibacteriota bacterium]